MNWNYRNNSGPQAQSVFSSFYNNDSSDDLGHISPGFAPVMGMNFPGDGEDRRPSIASAITVSSTGSRGSVSTRVQKKLQGFFGETEVPLGGEGSNSRQNSEASSMHNGSLPLFAPGGSASRDRNNSMNDSMLRSGPPSPGTSRPRTPAVLPNSEVTPWVFQDPEVCIKHA